MPLVAKVRFSSPLPQLDKEFDYLVPIELSSTIHFGQLVEVPFGPGGKAKTGIVCDVSTVEKPREKLLSISSIVSPFIVLTTEQLELCKAVAHRQAGTVGELIAGSVPKRFVRVESKPLVIELTMPAQSELHPDYLVDALKINSRLYFQPRLFDGGALPDWAANFVAACHAELLQGKSSLVVLPDFAELAKFERALKQFGLIDIVTRHSSADTGSVRYANHLRSIGSISINYGLRSSAFSPAKNLGLIILWDDGDESHIEQSSPYWNSREVLLQRAELEKVKIVLASHSPSTEVIRLVEINHLVPLISERDESSVLVTELTDRLDSQTFALISNTLKEGKPALVQIANSGWASALVCVGCKELRTCSNCSSSIWVDPSGKMRCRSCKSNIQQSACTCGKTSTRPTRLGASAFTSQMVRSFPDANVVHSNGENRLLKVKSGPLLVVATPGAEPEVEGGYACVVIADAPSMVGSPRLRALEQSLGKWANAISLSNKSASIVFTGLKGDLAEHMKQLSFYSAVAEDFNDRKDLGLPPITRIASITSTNSTDHQRLIELVRSKLDSDKVRELGVSQENTLVLDYSYSIGLELADLLKDLTLKLSATSKSKKPGERVYRINMDDGKVI
jgi:primosomal protein N' (replication factor Y) (superfamily II helicase)